MFAPPAEEILELPRLFISRRNQRAKYFKPRLEEVDIGERYVYIEADGGV